MTTESSTPDGADATDRERVDVALLAAETTVEELRRVAASRGLQVVYEGAPDHSNAARVGATAATVVVLVPAPDGPGPLAVLDALRERTTVPVVLYATDVDTADIEAFLAAEATDFVSRHPEGSDVVLAKRVRAAAEHATLVQSHGLLERAVDQADVGISIADARTGDEPLIYVNEGFARMTGYPVDETVGRNCRFLQGEATDPGTVATLRAAIESEEPASVDIRNYRKDGTEFWNHLDLSPIFDADGELTHYFGFQRDVTERKRLEAELREQNARLEDFASVLSHDLRNPLAIAQGRLADVDDPDVEAAEDALARMESLITDVLALARDGEDVEATDRVSLAEVATYAWSMVETDDLELDAPVDVVVHADRDRLVSLFENLFRNAMEHATGATTVEVSVTDDGFVVADDGPGIPEDAREDVFERGHTTARDGTGFGLAIVDAIATAHGWTVAVAESDGGGAAFVFADVDVERSR